MPALCPPTCDGWGARAPYAPAPWLRYWWPILPSVRKEMICYFFRTCTDHSAPCSLFCNYMPLNTFVAVGRPPSIPSTQSPGVLLAAGNSPGHLLTPLILNALLTIRHSYLALVWPRSRSGQYGTERNVATRLSPVCLSFSCMSAHS